MFSRIRKRFTYVNVVMTLALVLAMSGGAYAAGKYLITSTKQIKPSVLAQLKGKNGKSGGVGAQGPAGAKGETGPGGPGGAAGARGETGPAGPAGAKGETGPGGAAGARGETGPAGSPWTLGGVVPSGKTLMGNWLITVRASGASQAFGNSVSFVLPLSKTPVVHWIRENREEATATGEQKSTACLGTVAAPTATAGQLCVYTDTESGLSTNEAVNKFLFQWKWGLGLSASSVGFDTKALSNAEGAVAAGGSWAVTAE
jgi:hypothetical protein